MIGIGRVAVVAAAVGALTLGVPALSSAAGGTGVPVTSVGWSVHAQYPDGSAPVDYSGHAQYPGYGYPGFGIYPASGMMPGSPMMHGWGH